jgi:hypothetical protein
MLYVLVNHRLAAVFWLPCPALQPVHPVILILPGGGLACA